MALKIGPLAVDPPVVLAPMAGVTNAAFRRLCRSYGAGLYVSEMISARALVEGNDTTQRMVVLPTALTVAPDAVSMTQWPVSSVPSRPRNRVHRSTTSTAVAGLP